MEVSPPKLFGTSVLTDLFHSAKPGAYGETMSIMFAPQRHPQTLWTWFRPVAFFYVSYFREGPGAGRGPRQEGNAGLRPSYLVADASGFQLPHYAGDGDQYESTYRHVHKSGKRLGFGW